MKIQIQKEEKEEMWYTDLLYKLYLAVFAIVMQIFRTEEQKLISDFEEMFLEYLKSEEFNVGKAILEKAGYTVNVELQDKSQSQNRVINLKLNREDSQTDRDIYLNGSFSPEEALLRHKRYFNCRVDEASKELEKQE